MDRPNRRGLTVERLREILHYDPETGIFTWLVTLSNRGCAGTVAKGRSCGYLTIRINGILHYQHRLAWLYVNGQWPTEEIDHANGDKADNRLCNLRAATRSQNMLNKPRLKRAKNKYRGVCFHAESEQWMVRIGSRYIGRRPTEEEAHALYLEEMRKLTREFPLPLHEIDEIRQGVSNA